MTDNGRSGDAHRRGWRASLACGAAALAVLLASAAGAAAEQEGTPLSPPAVAPVSRLTITPSEFERWLAGTPERPDIAVAPEDLPAGPGLVAPPPPRLSAPSPAKVAPPPPALVTAPPPPKLAAPPPAANLAKAPAVPTPAPAGGPAETATAPGAVIPPSAPVLTPPRAPQVATLPPDSRDTTPVPAAPLPQPVEIRILYAADATDLPEAAREDLDGLVGWLKANPDVRVQIVGYASAAATTGSDARRRSLFRTLAVRTYLIENGVLSTRMDVRALGDRTEEEPKDRVEVRLPPS